MIYLYAIAEPLLGPRVGTGLQDSPLRVFASDGIDAVYSCHQNLECRPEPQALWEHHRVIERLMSTATILPARFGTTVEDTAALGTILNRRAPALRAQLEQVRGCVELAVRVGLPLAERPQPTGGREYLRHRLASKREREAVTARTLARLAEIAVSWKQPDRISAARSLSASYLVRANDVERFAAQVQGLQEHNAELAFSCTGPWAPYSFVPEESA
jgi:hypothetical protein